MKYIRIFTLILGLALLSISTSTAQTGDTPPKDADTPIANRTDGDYPTSQAIIDLLTQLIIKVI